MSEKKNKYHRNAQVRNDSKKPFRVWLIKNGNIVVPGISNASGDPVVGSKGSLNGYPSVADLVDHPTSGDYSYRFVFEELLSHDSLSNCEGISISLGESSNPVSMEYRVHQISASKKELQLEYYFKESHQHSKNAIITHIDPTVKHPVGGG